MVLSLVYMKVDWFNKFISYMWPYLDNAVCGIIRSSAQPIFADFVGTFCIESIEFEKLSLGPLPPTVHGKSLSHLALVISNRCFRCAING